MKNQDREKNREICRERIRKLILVIALAVFLISAYKLYSIFSEYQKAVDEYDNLRDEVVMEQTSDVEDRKDRQTDTYKKIVDFDKLKKMNDNIKGWIEFELIPISYPIMQGTDNDYYLHHTYRNTENTSGSIFLDYQNKELFKAQNTFIYGHNMKNGTMFGKLKQYERKEFYDKNQYIWIYTPTANYRYRIFSCYIVRSDGDSYQTDYKDKKEYENYLKMIQNYSSYDTGINLSTDDSIISLSTCTANPDNRFLVHAVRVETYEEK
ncbi:class B sortase [Anaerosacchariphilus polymeriproducens]|uniref:class B sortase n=1 Tax=Anaerosacchariphilus polymeriproducens TaxID=1812858 RepID=UPI00138FB256|nr:class B sortase [Anaerosacchariphilus polymeriproducens]